VAGEVLLVTQFLAAGLMLLLAGWLLYLNFHSRVVRAFSLFLLVRAMSILSNQFGRIMGEAFGESYWGGISGYYELAVVPAVAYFLVAYAGRDAGWKRWAAWLVLAFAVAVETAYAVDHCALRCDGVDEDTFAVGPLAIFTLAIPFAFAVAAIVLFTDARAKAARARRASAFLAGAVFFLNALVETSTTLSYAGQRGIEKFLRSYAANEWQLVPLLAALAAAAACLVAAAWLVRLHPRLDSSRAAPLVLGLGLLAIASGIFTAFYVPPDRFKSYDTVFLLGAWRLSLPIVISIAILRHRLFGLHWRIKKGIARGLVAGFLLATFFVVSKIAENKVTELFQDRRAGLYVGGVAAGLLLFAISPLQKVAERVAQATVSSRAIEKIPPPERLAFYREQANIAWGDGILGTRERLLLDRLRDQLGVSADDASRLESEAAAAGRAPAQADKRAIVGA
jgi:hypothetical protein